ncbi:MAG: DUF255 domain-containing protein [Bacteroidetes bacterium]|nr:DUF255 domain-containing protein [Bacteroidota bacterium]
MNKRNLILILIFSFAFYLPGVVNAQEKQKSSGKVAAIKWYSFEDAYKLNKKKPKKIFIDVYTDWCGWCKKMDAETFANQVIAKYMNDHFYCVKFNAERKDTIVLDGQVFVNPNPNSSRSTHKLAVDLLKGKLSYPSYVILSEKSQKLDVISGYQQAREFEGIIAFYGDDAYLKTPWEEFRANFKGEVK